MERGLEVTLKKQAESEKYPLEVRRAARIHLEETREHAHIVELLLKSLGSDTSTIKTGLGMMTETMKGLATSLSHDEPVKNVLASYAMEHFEIACYRSLVMAADLAGLPEVADACDQIVTDEERMAETISDALPQVIQDHLGGKSFAQAA